MNTRATTQPSRNRATVIGILFILAAFTSIIGLLLYGPILHDPDYVLKGTAHES